MLDNMSNHVRRPALNTYITPTFAPLFTTIIVPTSIKSYPVGTVASERLRPTRTTADLPGQPQVAPSNPFRVCDCPNSS
jgi:hypothetical protein